MIPDRTEALDLHRKLGSSEEIVRHCEAVASIASKIADRFRDKGFEDLNYRAIYAAALLHDIGRTKSNGPDHGYVGSTLLRENNVDDAVGRIVARHVGAGISKDEAAKLGMPAGDYVPRTLEERIVCFSDKVVGPRGRVLPFQFEIEKFKKKRLDPSRLENLKRSLEVELGEDPERILQSLFLSDIVYRRSFRGEEQSPRAPKMMGYVIEYFVRRRNSLLHGVLCRRFAFY